MSIALNPDYKFLKTLVVDDNMIMRNLITQSLRQMGILNIENASSGMEAIDKIAEAELKQEEYNIVFLDWHMPGMEGIEVLKGCRSQPALDSMAIIMVTAEQEENKVIEAIENGATSYLVKPVNLDILSSTMGKVNSWIEKNKGKTDGGKSSGSKGGNSTVKETVEETRSPPKNNNSHLSQRLCDELNPIVKSGIQNIFSNLFNVDTIPDSKIGDAKDQSMICVGNLYQDEVSINIRFFFDKKLLEPLLKNVYSDEFLQDPSIYGDAACEIVNILCAQVKAFLNKQGYELQLGIPQIDKDSLNDEGKEALMNVYFSLNEEDYFLVDVSEE